MAYQSSEILFNPWWVRRFNTFSKGTSPKVNLIARLEFELVYFEATVQHFSHFCTGTPTQAKKENKFIPYSVLFIFSINFSFYFSLISFFFLILFFHVFFPFFILNVFYLFLQKVFLFVLIFHPFSSLSYSSSSLWHFSSILSFHIQFFTPSL